MKTVFMAVVGLLTFAAPAQAANKRLWLYVGAVADTGSAGNWTDVKFDNQVYDEVGWHDTAVASRAVQDTVRVPSGYGGTYYVSASVAGALGADSVDAYRILFGVNRTHLTDTITGSLSSRCTPGEFVWLGYRYVMILQKHTRTGGTGVTPGSGKWGTFLKIDKLYL